MAALMDLAPIERLGDIRARWLANHAGIVVGRRRRPIRENRHAVQLAVGHAEVEAVDLERLADFVLQELADRAAIDAAQDLAVDVAVVQRVVGGALADREHRRQGRRCRGTCCPSRRASRACSRQASVGRRSDAPAHAQRGCLLAVSAKFGPDLDDRHVVIELVLFDEDMHARRRHAFGRRRQHEQRVAVDRLLRRFVGQTGPGIDDQLAIQIRSDLEADLRSCLSPVPRAWPGPSRWRQISEPGLPRNTRHGGRRRCTGKALNELPASQSSWFEVLKGRCCAVVCHGLLSSTSSCG